MWGVHHYRRLTPIVGGVYWFHRDIQNGRQHVKYLSMSKGHTEWWAACEVSLSVRVPQTMGWNETVVSIHGLHR